MMETQPLFPEYDAFVFEGSGVNANYVFSKLNTSDVLPPNSSHEAPTIPLYLYLIVSIVNALIFLVGTTGNSIVILIVIKIREMRTPTNVFLLNLSGADVLVLLVCQPAALVEFFGKDRWFLGKFMCKYIKVVYMWQ